jgi:hypothetical protein
MQIKKDEIYFQNNVKVVHAYLSQSIDISFVEKQIDKMNVNKATGKDGIAVKI